MQRSYQPSQASHYDHKQTNYHQKATNYEKIRPDHSFHRDAAPKTSSYKYSQKSPREDSY